ncbi:ImmA/IrrE family metallo-endopeptidase [Cellulomonas oligotrophica]|uniref:Zn-dependent peptidase ImmA (M78 family) n=1 Tax=Cellulomonas oligotrophica TaxID=931536 RepID=A0A7Y9FI83_9CELL|nr:ImmA/IrrE family metallo-endopeptidase [Cellulomonas oligotrophica]NYD87805.1 Zn-dependent peptidase ImmA (M78 family) [Cellulomonas oligotrophica]GIG32990.1 hypothetical protein Col01nite_21490 [Cellulomonas oligotrophica]
MDELLELADRAGIRVDWRDLGLRRGEYRHGPRLITINSRMSGVLQRSTLAHELGHVHYGDRLNYDARIAGARERRANAYAARLLIDPGRYAEAERVMGPDAGTLARELEVAQYVVEAWRTQHRLAFVPTPRGSR